MPITVVCSCGREFRVMDEHGGKLIRCPACREPVRIPTEPDPEPTQLPPGPPRPARRPVAVPAAARPSVQPPSPPTPPPAPPPSSPSLVAHPVVGRTNRGGFPLPWQARWAWYLISFIYPGCRGARPAAVPSSVQPPPLPVKVSPHELPPPVADPIVGRTNRGGFAFPWRARWTWYLIFWGVFFFVAFLFDSTKFGGFAFLAVFWLLLVGRYVTTWVVPLCHRSFTCPGCREVHPAVGYWNCGCGYKPHKPKHLFSKCPACGEGGGRTDCLRCGATMLLW